MFEVLGSVGGEGGPFLIVDRVLATGWQGADEGSTDYEQVYALPEGGGTVAVSAGLGVAWDAEGAALVTVARYADDRLLLHRSWADDDGGSPVPTSSDAPTSDAVEFARFSITSDDLIILWSPFGWGDVTDDSMWDPPPPGVFHLLHSPPMANIGMQVPAPSGTYVCRRESLGDDVIRCWIESEAQA